MQRREELALKRKRVGDDGFMRTPFLGEATFSEKELVERFQKLYMDSESVIGAPYSGRVGVLLEDTVNLAEIYQAARDHVPGVWAVLRDLGITDIPDLDSDLEEMSSSLDEESTDDWDYDAFCQACEENRVEWLQRLAKTHPEKLQQWLLCCLKWLFFSLYFCPKNRAC